MYLERIHLRDWKCFRDAEFEFPSPDEKRIVLIGGQNGAGKTSLMEGLLVGMYGNQAVDLISERETIPGTRDRPYYNEIIRNSVNRSAVSESARPKSKITVAFRDGDERIVIERVFHVRPGQPHEEELQVWQGSADDDGLKPIEVGSDDKQRELQDYIESAILPHDLAGFFFFDGEQVQRLASRDRSEVTRNGLEQLFGLKVLRTLQSDLKTHGANCRKNAKRTGDRPRLETVEAEIGSLESEIQDIERNIRESSDEMQKLQKKFDKIAQRIKNAYHGTHRNVQEIVEELAKLEAAKKQIETGFEGMLGGSLALALAAKTGAQVKRQLDAEAELDRWEAARASIGDQLKKLESNLASIDDPEIIPELTDGQWAALRERIARAYEGLFVPPPDDLADHRRLGHVGKEMRGIVEARLAETGGLASQQLVESLNQLETIATKQRLKEEDKEALSEGSAVNSWLKENQEISHAIGRLEKEIEENNSKLKARKAEMKAKKAEWGLIQKSVEAPDIQGKVADLCGKIRDMLGQFIGELAVMKNEQVSKEMTRIYKSLARKEGIVDKICINEDGSVSFFGEENVDLGHQEFSAGEKEIFALSWLAAAGKVGGNNMPMMIDTPMARLDATHRMNICREYLPNAAPQMIVLSTDTEIVGEYQEAIEPYISERFFVEFDTANETSHVISTEYFLREMDENDAN